MEDSQQRRVGRPRTAVLDRGRIADAALAAVDMDGDFTLPALARRLGVQTASLYYHVDGRAGVIALLHARLGELIDLSPLELRPWDVALEQFFRSYRDVYAAHPRLAPLLATSSIREPQVIAGYESLVGILVEAGISSHEVLSIVTAMESFVIGSALDLAAPEVMWEVGDVADAPHLVEALAQQDLTRGRADRAFELGLQVFLEAVRIRQAMREHG